MNEDTFSFLMGTAIGFWIVGVIALIDFILKI